MVRRARPGPLRSGHYGGRWQAALETAHTVADNAYSTTDARILALIAFGRLLTRQGDPLARAALDEALRLALPTDELQYIAPVRAARAELAWWSGDPEACRTEVHAVCDLAVSREQSWMIGELAYWLWRAGDTAAPRPGDAEPFARQIAGDWAGAAGCWQELGCPYERACALADSPDVESLNAALTITEELGARPLARKLVASLRKRGVRRTSSMSVAKQQPSASAPLSPRERDVAVLVAHGCTNREIAERLVISERTAENHVQRILNRLELRSRTELATWAIKNGLE